MNEAELRDVIEGPPRELGASVDPELIKKLIRDIGLDPASGRSDEYDIGKLPLLEYALEQAWAKRTGPEIGLPQYSGLEQALEERANALYGRLSAEEQAAAKRLFVSLVTPGEGREDTPRPDQYAGRRDDADGDSDIRWRRGASRRHRRGPAAAVPSRSATRLSSAIGTSCAPGSTRTAISFGRASS
jgi:hypothetical protein